MKPFLHWEKSSLPIFSAYFAVAEQETCHASSKTQTENHEEREECYIFTLDANWKNFYSKPVNQKIEESLRVVILKITQ